MGMFYCEGKNCSRRDQCAYHESFEWKYPRQYLDQSTNGTGWGGIDKKGNNFFEHRYNCGDKADYYYSYKALGWREGQEYKNSEGTICDEICLSCPHKSLCFCVLEAAGMVFQPGDRVRYNCEEIKVSPRQYRKWLVERGWRKELLDELL
jgi:hypothetical protein